MQNSVQSKTLQSSVMQNSLMQNSVQALSCKTLCKALSCKTLCKLRQNSVQSSVMQNSVQSSVMQNSVMQNSVQSSVMQNSVQRQNSACMCKALSCKTLHVCTSICRACTALSLTFHVVTYIHICTLSKLCIYMHGNCVEVLHTALHAAICVWCNYCQFFRVQ